MKCPKCESEKISVLDSRGDGEAIRRRRECQGCMHRFTTYERIERALPMIVKKDGRREPFSRDKLRAGIVRACEKRPVSMETIAATIDTIEKRLQDLCEREVPSREVGDILMEELRTLDKVAYIRFASVYQEFSDTQHFVEVLKSLDEKVSANIRLRCAQGEE